MKKKIQKKRISMICRKLRMARRRGQVGIGHGLNIKFFKLPEEETQYRQYAEHVSQRGQQLDIVTPNYLPDEYGDMPPQHTFTLNNRKIEIKTIHQSRRILDEAYKMFTK